jgi:signal transduction histidine kinase
MDQLVLIVEDDGVGISREIELTSANSLGLRLVDALVSQLDGTIQLDRERGTKFTIQFVSVAPASPRSTKATDNDTPSNGHSTVRGPHIALAAD